MATRRPWGWLRAALPLLAILHVHATSLSCPDTCHCTPDLRQASCDAAGGSFPEDLPSSLETLVVTGSNLTFLNSSQLTSLTRLTHLDLSNNSLVAIAEDALTGLPLTTLHLQDNQLDDDVLSALPPQLEELSLANNYLQLNWSQLNNGTNGSHPLPWPSLHTLDLSYNDITDLPPGSFRGLQALTYLNLSHNQLTYLEGTESLSQLEHLDLSYNALEEVASDALAGLGALQWLDLAYNPLSVLPPHLLQDLASLTWLCLSHTHVGRLENGTFDGCAALQELDLSHQQRLWYLAPDALQGLTSLEVLHLDHNPDLRHLPPNVFRDLDGLRILDLSHSALSGLDAAVLYPLQIVETVSLAGNPWMCDCHLVWLQAALAHNATAYLSEPESVTCSHPASLSGQPLLQVPSHNLTCASATITNTTTRVVAFKIGSAAVLDCLTDGRPHPAIRWTSPRKQLLHYDPSYGSEGRLPPGHTHYHSDHVWHEGSHYFRDLSVPHRIHVLRNGSLYIDYVKRHDGGIYHCYVENHLGNDSAVIRFLLDYDTLRETYIWSLYTGGLAALGFLFIGLMLGLIRRTINKCSVERNVKRGHISDILQTLDDYKSVQFDKFSAYRDAKMDRLNAYRTAKFDQFSAYRIAKVDKLRSYRKLTMSTVVQHMQRMREHYSTSVVRIRDNCANNADKVRAHYCNNKDKLKDYRSHQIEKLRDNYASQMNKIRDYGSSQMERLREQYKLQQLHVLKLLEIMDIGNCMTVIEAECLRTESMIFDPDFHLDFDTHPVHIMPDPDFSDSEYETASNSSRPKIDDLPDLPLEEPELSDFPELPLEDLTFQGELEVPEVVIDPMAPPMVPLHSLRLVTEGTPKPTPSKSHKRHRRHRANHESGSSSVHDTITSSQEDLAQTNPKPRKKKHHHRRDKSKDRHHGHRKHHRHRTSSGSKDDKHAAASSSKPSTSTAEQSVDIIKHPPPKMAEDLDRHSSQADVSEYASAAQSREQSPETELPPLMVAARPQSLPVQTRVSLQPHSQVSKESNV